MYIYIYILYIYVCVCVCVCVDVYIYVDDYTYICSPIPVGLSSLVNEVIVLPLAFIARLFIYELSSW